MEIAGEILIFVLVFVVITGGIYYFVSYAGDGGGSEIEEIVGDDLTDVTNDSLVGDTVADGGNDTDEDNVTEIGDAFDSEEIHWDHMPLSYKINNKSNCIGQPIEDLEEAFSLVEDSTGGEVSFVEGSGDVDITVNCVDRNALLENINEGIDCDKIVLDGGAVDLFGYEVISEGDYVTNVRVLERNATNNVFEVCHVDMSSDFGFDWDLIIENNPLVEGGVIKKGSIEIYELGTVRCASFPSREVHEILHSLGFDHSLTPSFNSYFGWREGDVIYFRNIMFPYSSCAYQNQIDDEYSSCLKKIYSGEGDCGGVNFVES